MLFIIDFDGTVAPADTVDALLERFANPEWRRIEAEWVAGRINSRQCMAAQLALVDGDRASLEEFLCSVAIDPSFPAFVRHVFPFADVAIVSDGLDYPIRHALQKLDIPPIPIYANKLEFRPGGLNISFPYTEIDCAFKSGVCKCAVARSVDAGRGLTTVLIGDGRSDLCIARAADYVFAKNSLQRYCESEGIIHTPFETFHDVLAVVRDWNVEERTLSFQEAACPSV
jgi:2-hydroxy-3-keto-5-methylthiopentenyl-1-phosphate phosphatase